MHLPPHIADLVERAVRTLDADGNLVESRGAAYGALPLLADLGGGWFLRPDGVFLEVRWDENEDDPDKLDHTPIAALVVGAERYSWLSELIPKRPAAAIDCPDCGGHGKIFVPGSEHHHGFLCGKCNVLGWTMPRAG